MQGSTKQAKRLVIKNFRGQRLPEDYEATSWATLKEGLEAIFAGRVDAISLESLYRTCENVCRCRMAHVLYSKLYSECEAHTQTFVLRLQQQLDASCSGTEFLRFVSDLWEEHVGQVRLVSSVFLYLDRVFVMSHPELAPIWDFSMIFFRSCILSVQAFREVLCKAILDAIDHDRRNSMSETIPLLISILQMLTSVKLLDEWLKPDLADASTSFFAKESQEKLSTLSIPQYLGHVEQCICDERIRYENYKLDAKYSSELLARVKDALFVSHLDTILQKGLSGMIDGPNMVALGLLYGLGRDTNTLDRVRDSWSAFIKTRGGQLLSDLSKNEMVVSELIALKASLDAIITEAFEGDAVFASSMKESFESFMNSIPNRPAELMAKYVDFQLRGGASEDMSKRELEEILEKIIVLFRFIQCKDVFEITYKRYLIYRLLLSRTISLDAEKTFVAQLKHECGSTFTSRLEGIFKDLEISKETMLAYGKSPRTRKAPESIDMNVVVITSGLWPYPPLVNLNLPSAVIKAQEDFVQFYQESHRGRLLTWHQGMGHCVMKANFAQGAKELQVSILQAVVLLQFNQEDQLSYEVLSERTGLNDANLMRTLQSLSYRKIPILIKTPKDQEVSKQDLFAYNGDFTSKHHRIRINMQHSYEASRERPSATGDVSEDHHHVIDAAIVRLLKAHKQLSSDRLIELVTRQLNFAVHSTDIMERLPTLIEREFISNDAQDSTLYTYLC